MSFIKVTSDDSSPTRTGFTNIGAADEVVPNIRLNILGKSAINRRFTSVDFADKQETVGIVSLAAENIFGESIPNIFGGFESIDNEHSSTLDSLTSSYNITYDILARPYTYCKIFRNIDDNQIFNN